MLKLTVFLNCAKLEMPRSTDSSVVDPEGFDADPDPTLQADADPDPNFFLPRERKQFLQNLTYSFQNLTKLY